MTIHTPGSNEWLKSVTERTIDPDRLIIDPHHHLWRRPNGNDYLLENLWQDTGSGHNIQKTVFVECHAEYRTEGLEAFKVLGETAFVTDQAKLSETAPGSTQMQPSVESLGTRTSLLVITFRIFFIGILNWQKAGLEVSAMRVHMLNVLKH